MRGTITNFTGMILIENFSENKTLNNISKSDCIAQLEQFGFEVIGTNNFGDIYKHAEITENCRPTLIVFINDMQIGYFQNIELKEWNA